MPSALIEPITSGALTLVHRRLLEGADPNAPEGPEAITPLMAAYAHDRREMVALLLQHGADPSRTDALGRTFVQHRALATAARVRRFAAQNRAIRAAYLAALHFPHTHQFTSPVVALELDGPLSPDAFAGWPTDDPIVAFMLAADAISALIRRSPPVFERGEPSRGQQLAEAIARALDGAVRVVPSEPGFPQHAVSLASGEWPVLVRDHPRSVTVFVPPNQSWSVSADGEWAPLVEPVAAAARRWSEAHAGALTMVELASEVARALSREAGDRFSVSTPGTAVPREMWLHGERRDEAAVGVFEERLVIWLDGEALQISVRERADVPRVSAEATAAVAAQRARHRAHRARSDRITTLTHHLAGRLAAAERATWSWGINGVCGYAGPVDGHVRRDDEEVARVFVQGEVITLHAGLSGNDGLELPYAEDTPLPPILAAIEDRARALTLRSLREGARYRVLVSIQQLTAGTVVTYRGLDDIDNHYGEYVFETEGGQKVVVAGDCSTDAGSPLREVHRHLERA